jgi:hypothetical protein
MTVYFASVWYLAGQEGDRTMAKHIVVSPVLVLLAVVSCTTSDQKPEALQISVHGDRLIEGVYNDGTAAVAFRAEQVSAEGAKVELKVGGRSIVLGANASPDNEPWVQKGYLTTTEAKAVEGLEKALSFIDEQGCDNSTMAEKDLMGLVNLVARIQTNRPRTLVTEETADTLLTDGPAKERTASAVDSGTFVDFEGSCAWLRCANCNNATGACGYGCIDSEARLAWKFSASTRPCGRQLQVVNRSNGRSTYAKVWDQSCCGRWEGTQQVMTNLGAGYGSGACSSSGSCAACPRAYGTCWGYGYGRITSADVYY